LPLAYRDIRDAVERCKWPDKEQLETWFITMDDLVFEMAEKQRENKVKKS
jgi:uncharacterized protein YeaC (DUF1315 family)